MGAGKAIGRPWVTWEKTSSMKKSMPMVAIRDAREVEDEEPGVGAGEPGDGEGEVQLVHDAEDHGEADADEGVGGAEEEAVQQLLNDVQDEVSHSQTEEGKIPSPHPLPLTPPSPPAGERMKVRGPRAGVPRETATSAGRGGRPSRRSSPRRRRRASAIRGRRAASPCRAARRTPSPLPGRRGGACGPAPPSWTSPPPPRSR